MTPPFGRRGATTPELAARARGLVPAGRRAVVGVAGPPGAGKSHLVEALLEGLRREPPPGSDADRWVAHVPMDGFHLADAALERLGLVDRKGAPETFDADGYAALLRRVRVDTDHTVYAPGFERTLEQPVAGSIAVHPETRLVLTEGNYLLLDEPAWRRVHAELDEVWYVDTDHAVRRTRLVARHERFGKSPAAARAWVERVDEANAVLVESTRHRADLVVTELAG